MNQATSVCQDDQEKLDAMERMVNQASRVHMVKMASPVLKVNAEQTVFKVRQALLVLMASVVDATVSQSMNLRMKSWTTMTLTTTATWSFLSTRN